MHGLLVLDKPPGVTSHGALLPVKRALGRRVRVGHAGTLDPFATGVLLVLVGDATRLSSLAMRLEKSYEAVVLFGEETDTHDPDGELLRTADPGPAAPEELGDALAAWTGDVLQRPPAYSAKKVDGRRAYRLARSGGDPRLAPKRVTIREIRRLDEGWPEVRLSIRCGTGTYIRALARDLGRALSLPARLDVLRRTAVGPFRAGEGLAIAAGGTVRRECIEERIAPPLAVTRAAGLPEVALAREDALRLALGGEASVPAGAASGPTDEVALVSGGALVALARIGEGGRLRPIRVLAGARDRLSGS